MGKIKDWFKEFDAKGAVKILAEAILEQQKQTQICPETIKKLEELSK
jgi:hypothetical protein